MGAPLHARKALFIPYLDQTGVPDSKRPAGFKSAKSTTLGGGGAASKSQPRNVVSARSEEPKTILRRGVKNSG
jgi:hypothetical protein|tara:strand:+ start:386 stop:604 length:219 start_codon:yes stop_codon:yes gene_type:complete